MRRREVAAMGAKTRRRSKQRGTCPNKESKSVQALRGAARLLPSFRLCTNVEEPRVHLMAGCRVP